MKKTVEQKWLPNKEARLQFDKHNIGICCGNCIYCPVKIKYFRCRCRFTHANIVNDLLTHSKLHRNFERNTSDTAYTVFGLICLPRHLLYTLPSLSTRMYLDLRSTIVVLNMALHSFVPLCNFFIWDSWGTHKWWLRVSLLLCTRGEN